MNGYTSYDTYRELQVTTATPEKLIIMLYDGAIDFLEQARLKLAAGDWVTKGALIGKAISIICELMGSVNAEAGDIAKNLKSLYAYFLHRLLDADFNKSEEGINEVIHLMKDLRDSWMQVSKKTIVKQ